MPTRSTIRTRVLSLLANHDKIAASDINTLINQEHEEILEAWSWSRRKQENIIDTVSEYSTGTVSTSGTVVTGSGTTFTSGMVDRFIRIGSNTFFHRITAFTDTTTLTIEQALPSDAAAGSSYAIFRHRYDLASDFGRVLNITSDTRLQEWSKSDIDRIDPYRTSTATRPDKYTIIGPDSDGNFQIEFWPVPSSAQAIRVEYLRTNSLSADTDSPLYRGDILVWKVAESGAFFLYARTGDQAWLQLADRYHARYLESFNEAKEEDLGKFSPAAYIRDRATAFDRGDDWYISHDPLGPFVR